MPRRCAVGITEWFALRSTMKHYYKDDWVTLYHGDSAEILDALTADVLITDVPYGVNLGATKGTGGKHGLIREGYEGYEDSYANYTGKIVPIVERALKKVKRAAVITGPHMKEMPKWDALGAIYNSAGAGRHCWGFKLLHPVLLYGTAPNLQNGARPTVLVSNATADDNGHPCPKPLKWMTWLVELASLPTETVLDPFAGSGQTLRAAKELGRRSIGVELNEKYCEMVARSCSQEMLPLCSANARTQRPRAASGSLE